MDYEKKYKEALKRAKYYKEGITDRKLENGENILDYIFPELKESEDEKIRRCISDVVRKYGVEFTTGNITKEKMLVWLEKQGKEEYALKSSKDEDVRKFMQQLKKEAKDYEFNLPNRDYDIYAFAKDILAWLEKQGEQKQHLELKAGHWYFCHQAYCCRADHLTVKEGERFMCEEDGVVKGFVIKNPEKYFKEVCAPTPIDDEQKLADKPQPKQIEQKETLCDKCRKAQPSHSCQDITELGRCAVDNL